MAGKVAATTKFLLLCSVQYNCVMGMNSSTLGRYFMFQLTGLDHRGARCIARAFTISLAGVSVTLTLSRATNHSMNQTETATQNHPAVFMISHVLLTCTNIGLCGTFVFRSDGGDVSLDVLGLHGPHNGDVMQVIPVSGLGTQYYLMTVGQRAFLIIFSPNDNTGITLKQKSKAGVNRNCVTGLGDDIGFLLHREQSMNLCNCQVNEKDFKGLFLSSNRSFGVITGNCVTRIPSNVTCGAAETKGNYLTDMILPVETYGRHFVVIETEVQTSSFRYAVVVTSEVNTTVQVVETVVQHKVVVQAAGAQFALYSFPSQHYFIAADKPCSCYLVIPSPCRETDIGDGSVTVVVPVELFFNLYMWSFQTDGYSADMQTSVLLVAHTWYSNRIQLNGTLLRDKYDVRWSRVVGSADWVVGRVDIRGGGAHYAALTSSLHRFGCYILVSKEGFGFVSNAGFILSNLNVDFKACVNTVDSKNVDYTDNDCDGKVDEEIKNDIDDDGDDLIDEDIGRPDLVAGKWTAWQQWTCKDECGNSTYVKYRHCRAAHGSEPDIPCRGVDETTKSGVCRTNRPCQDGGCPRGTYGTKCDRDCSNCESKCHPLNGSCASCRPGWTEPQFACVQECPKWTYGDKCKHLCELKCGEDCSERVQGLCPGDKAFLSMMMPFIFSPMLACCFFVAACTLFKYKFEKYELDGHDMTESTKSSDVNTAASFSMTTDV